MKKDNLRIASVNVNGLRAAYKKGMAEWLEPREVDILCLEVRAPDAIVHELLGEGWYILHAEAEAKGRAGVAIASRTEPLQTRVGIGEDYFAAGRWVEPTTSSATRRGSLTADRRQRLCALRRGGHPEQDDKFRFLDVMADRLPELAKHSDHALVVGDLNVGHTELDIRNWKGNVKRAGFLPEERAYFDRFFGEDIGWKDVLGAWRVTSTAPTLGGRGGDTFDNDTGCALITTWPRALAAAAVSAVVDRAPSWDTRFSDHAPLVVDYRL